MVNESTLPSGESQPLLPSSHTPRGGLSEGPSQVYGYGLMMLSTIGFSGMTTLVHILGSPLYSFDVPSLLIVWFRSVIQLVLALLFLATLVDVRARLPSITRDIALLILLRGCLGTVGFICLFKALSLLPLGEAMTLFFLGPIFTTILTSATLGEHVTAMEWVLSLASFLGVALIAHPGASAATAALTHSRALGIFLAISAAALSAGAYSVVRLLGGRVHFMFNVLSLGACSSVATTVWLWPTLALSLRVFAKTPATLALLVAQGCFAFFGQCFLNSALQHAGGLSVMMRNLDVPLAYTFGLLLGELPSWQATVGSAIVVLASGVISLRRVLRSRR